MFLFPCFDFSFKMVLGFYVTMKLAMQLLYLCIQGFQSCPKFLIFVLKDFYSFEYFGHMHTIDGFRPKMVA